MTCVCEEIGIRAQNMITFLGSMVNMIIGRGPIWPFHEHDKLFHSDNE